MKVRSTARLLVYLIWHQLIGHRRKNAITCAVLAFNSIFVVIGAAVVNSVQQRTFSLISTTMLGDFQVYDANAPEQMAIAQASVGREQAELNVIDYGKVRALAMQNSNVAQVVPMGTILTTCILPNALEARVTALRDAIAGGDPTTIETIARQVRARLEGLSDEIDKLRMASNVALPYKGDPHTLQRARSQSFWDDFRKHPSDGIFLLESEVVPLAGDPIAMPFPIMGVDLPRFENGFPAYRLYAGSWVPPGRRGVMLNKYLWDNTFKLPVALEFDRLYKELVVEKKALAPELVAERSKMMARSSDDLLVQLESDTAKNLTRKLQEFLRNESDDLGTLMTALLSVDSTTVASRYEFFQKVVAPMVRLHRVAPGDEIMIRAWGHFPTSVIVKVYGVLEVTAFKDIPNANHYNFIDFVSYRVLDGETTPETEAEYAAVRAQVPTKEVELEDIESLFAKTSTEIVTEDFLSKPSEGETIIKSVGKLPDEFTQAQVDDGRVEHAAVILKDKTKLDQTRREILASAADAGIHLQPGGVFQALPVLAHTFLFLRALVLGGAAVVFLSIILVSLVAISILILGRFREIGILRAIGAAPAVAVKSLVGEMVFLGTFAGVIGSAIGSLAVRVAAIDGIAAPVPWLKVLFGGPRLFPSASATDVLLGIGTTAVAAFIATLYPARLASRVSPASALKDTKT